jgi:hypothetical protein
MNEDERAVRQARCWKPYLVGLEAMSPLLVFVNLELLTNRADWPDGI